MNRLSPCHVFVSRVPVTCPCHVSFPLVSWQRSVWRNVSTDSFFELDIASDTTLAASDDARSTMRRGDGVVVDTRGLVVGTVTVHATWGPSRDDSSRHDDDGGVTVTEEGDGWDLAGLFHEETPWTGAGGKTGRDGERGDAWARGDVADVTASEAVNAGGDRADLA